MDEALFVLALVLIVIGIPVIGGVWLVREKERLRLRAREMELLGSRTAESVAQYAARTERLEQRVCVLERVVTEKGFDLAMDIDRLAVEPAQR